MAKQGKTKKKNPGKEAFEQGYRMVRRHPMFEPLTVYANVYREKAYDYPENGYARVYANGNILLNPDKRLSKQQNAFVIAHCLLHLAFNHFTHRKPNNELWNMACDLVAYKFLLDMKFGQPLKAMAFLLEGIPCTNEDNLYEYLDNNAYNPDLAKMGTGNFGMSGMSSTSGSTPDSRSQNRWQLLFSRGLQAAVTSAVNVAGGESSELSTSHILKTAAELARSWFISHYPLLGSLAGCMNIIENKEICQKYDIRIAAIDIAMKEIYLNPVAGLTGSEMRFVIAHEMLHAGLQHNTRRQGRDPFYWNVACDYVINGWLNQMSVGDMPPGALHDPSLDGLSAEEVYDTIVTDLRRLRKIATLAGEGKCDILPTTDVNWYDSEQGQDLDEFYRSCLAQGLEVHQQQQRGFLPSGLVEAINALDQPPIRWDVELAKWFDGHFAPLEKRRSYARMSRRQSSSPDIPMPRYIADDQAEQNRTYGVVLDTSGSMDRQLLAKALGTIVSYSLSRDVSRIRLVFCDAEAYDQGYVRPEDLAERVQVKGRGGTELQPAINLLESADDFPKKGPILIITDGDCDRLSIHREHAYVMPAGCHLRHVPKGPVFRVQ
jgi:predicted metal-dependent peptidase